MPAKTRLITAALLLAACATSDRAAEPEGADRLDAAVSAKVREGREAGYPDLSDVPARAATPADAAALASDAGTLAEEAAALRALQAAAATPRPPSDLPARARRLRREVASARAELQAQPPIERPGPRDDAR